MTTCNDHRLATALTFLILIFIMSRTEIQEGVTNNDNELYKMILREPPLIVREQAGLLYSGSVHLYCRRHLFVCICFQLIMNIIDTIKYIHI